MHYPDNTDDMTDEQLGSWVEANVLDAPSASVAKLSQGSEASKALAAPMPLSGLPPRLREPIEEELKSVPFHRREEVTRRLIDEALMANSRAVRVVGGIGSDANAYDRAFFDLASEQDQLNRQAEVIESQLAEITGYDPETGKAVFANQGQRRKALEAEYLRLGHALERLKDEAPARLAKAKQDAVAEIRANRQALADQAEVKRRVAEGERERRIQKQVDVKLRLSDNVLP